MITEIDEQMSLREVEISLENRFNSDPQSSFDYRTHLTPDLWSNMLFIKYLRGLPYFILGQKDFKNGIKKAGSHL